MAPEDDDPGEPDLRGPWRYLWWLISRYPWSLLCASASRGVWLATMGATPGLIGAAVSDGLVARDQRALFGWGLVVLALGVVQAVTATGGDRLAFLPKVAAGYLTLRLVTAHVCELGAETGRRTSAGDLVTVGVSDITLLGEAIDSASRGAGAVAAFAVVAALMLATSWPAGLLVLAGVPLILLVTTRIGRLLRTRQDGLRASQRELTDEAVNIVRGLRVLRGFGGEEIAAARYTAGSQRLRSAAVHQAGANALLQAASAFLPGLLLVAVVALVSDLVLARGLSVGQLVAFYGYAAFLRLPVTWMTSAVGRAMQAHVAAAHVVRLLRTPPLIAAGPSPAPMPEPGQALADAESGLEIPPGLLTAVVCTPADAALLADRLGRYTESVGTAYGGVPLRDLPLDDVRERILVTEPEARLFAGELRAELDPGGDPGDDARLWAAVDSAAARDVIGALPDGFGTVVAPDGQGFSGGQRQRLRLARALLADPEVLILIDPASAVDAHTEAMMADGIARLRRGRTTVVFTTSLLQLTRADRAVLVLDGIAVAEGGHETLLRGDLRYQSLVERGVAG